MVGAGSRIYVPTTNQPSLRIGVEGEGIGGGGRKARQLGGEGRRWVVSEGEEGGDIVVVRLEGRGREE